MRLIERVLDMDNLEDAWLNVAENQGGRNPNHAVRGIETPFSRPALALDLVEEFRSVIVDSVVLNLANREMLTAADFRPGREGGVYLKRQALRTFFRQYSSRLNTKRLHPGVGRTLTYQQWFEVQARTLRQAIEGEIPAYRPMVVR